MVFIVIVLMIYTIFLHDMQIFSLIFKRRTINIFNVNLISIIFNYLGLILIERLNKTTNTYRIKLLKYFYQALSIVKI